ncbi:MAG: CHAT domain-containing protein [Planctomycetota bacterium]
MSEVPGDETESATERVLAEFFADGTRCDVAEFDAWARERADLRDDDALRAAVVRHVRQWAELQRLISSTSGGERSPADIDARALQAGDALGPFTLEEFLARGGMGQVWIARRRDSDERVALKLVRPERVDERSLAMFEREARAGGRLDHPNVVQTLGHGDDDGVAWIAQELVVDAVSLRARLEALDRSGLPAGHFGWAADVIARIADGLHAAHEVGVIHRDVTPQNILVAPSGQPKVIDFGLARVKDDPFHSRTGDFAGTWGYMSPEQVTAKRMGLDHRTDVFSLGVVLYELLTLRRPFDGDTTHQIATNIITAEPVDPRRVRSKCPRGLALIAAKALEKLPSKRYATMAAFAEDLRRYLREEPTDARELGRIERARRWIRRHPTAALVAGVTAVAVVLLTTLLVAYASKASELADRTADLAQRTQSLERANDELGDTQDRLQREAAAARENAELLATGQIAAAARLRIEGPAVARVRIPDEYARLFRAMAVSENNGLSDDLAHLHFACLETLRAAAFEVGAVDRLIDADDGLVELRTAIDEARQELQAVIDDGAGPDEDVDAWSEAITEARRDLDDRIFDLRRELSSDGALPRSVSSDAVIARLGPGEVAASFLRYPRDVSDDGGAATDHYVAFVLDGTSDEVRRVELGPAVQIDALVADWRLSMGRVQGPTRGGAESEPDELDVEQRAGALLRAALLDPVLDVLPAAPRVVRYVPDGDVHLVSLEALTASDGRRIGDDVDFRRHLYLADGRVGAIRATGREEFVAVGDVDFDAGVEEGAPRGPFDPLYATSDEIKRAGALFEAAHGRAPVLLSGPGATQEEVLTAAPRARYLHFATHGLTSSSDDGGSTAADRTIDLLRGLAPMALGGLALAGANGGSPESLLTGAEILALDLDGCELAVLAANDSASGAMDAARSQASLQRALHAAGVRRSIAPIGNVSDFDSKELMEHFYGALFRGGLEPGRALAEAKRRMRDANVPASAWAHWVLVETW